MVDNVDVTPGSGKTMRSEDIAGIQYAIAKLAAGKAGSTVMLGHLEDDAHNSGDAGIMALAIRKATPADLVADGDYAGLQIDDSGRLWVRPAPVQKRIVITPTLNGTTYTSGDCLGGLQTLSNAARFSGGSGVIQSVIITDKTQAQRAAIDLALFDRSISVAGNNSPIATSDADNLFSLGVISIGPYNTVWPGTPLNSVSTLYNVGAPFVLNGTDLFIQAVVRGAPTYADGDLQFAYIILQD